MYRHIPAGRVKRVAIFFLLTGCGGEASRMTTNVTPTTAPAAQVTPGSDHVDYASPDGAFKTGYPVSWKTKKGDATLNLLPVNDSSGGKRLVTLDVPDIPFHLPGMVTMERVENGYQSDLKKKYPGLNITSDADETFPDAKGKRIKATAQDGTVIETLLAVRHDHVYIIASQTDPAGAHDGQAAVNMIEKSWQWTEK
jgi:hypothetical protein